MSVFGRSYGHDISGNGCTSTARKSHARTPRQAIEHGIAYATEDRKRYGLNLIEDIKRNISAAALGKLVAGAGWTRTRSRWWPTATGKSMKIKAPTVAVITGKLSRRQPAEGGAEQVDVLRPRRADPRRADPRHRRRAPSTRSTRSSIALAAEGKAIIVISSELPELLGICDRIYALSAGHITGEVPIEPKPPRKRSCST